jgi:hypothetical protein
MGYVDFKITTWERVQIDDDKVAEVIELIKSGEINSSNDLIDYEEKDFGQLYDGVITETEEQMLPEENDGQSTIEVYNDNKKLEFDNSLTKE